VQTEAPINEQSHHLRGLLALRGLRILFLLLGATALGLTLVYPSLWWLEWLALIPSFLSIYAITERPLRLRRYYLYGLTFYWMHGIVVFHWFISMYPLSFADLSGGAAVAVVLAGVLGLSLLQALISAFAFVLFAFLSRGQMLSHHPILKPFLFAAVWTVLEWVQTLGWWGVPWGRLSLGQIDCLPLVGSISLLGSYFLTFTIVLTSALLAYAVLYAGKRRLASALAAGVFLLNLLLGVTASALRPVSEASIRVAAIQGNIENKWMLDLSDTKEAYQRLTLLASDEGAELILWPETALPVLLNESPKTLQWVQNLARNAEATILVGAYRSALTENGEKREYNCLIAVLSDGRVLNTAYDKQHIVPFGEYVPMRSFITAIFPPLAEINMLSSDIHMGETDGTIPLDSGIVGGMICFDSIYEDVALSAVQNGAQFFCLASNDLWFMDSAAIYMHFAQARLRAIETGREILRAGNSGITAIIRYNGEVTDSLPPLTEGYVVGDVSLYSHRTLYSVIGNAFVYTCMALILALAVETVWSLVQRKKHKEQSQVKQTEHHCYVVLGAKIHNSEPGRALKMRLDAAVTDAEQQGSPSCFIVSGGRGEAEAMLRYLVSRGIPEERIMTENRARTTEENLLYSMPLLDGTEHITVVTSNFHILRTKHIARRTGFRFDRMLASKTPIDVLPKALLREIGALILEYTK
jgi:apolipoprotein N-acyltransferase